MITGLVSLLFAFRHFHVYFIIHFRITRSPRPRSFRSGNKLYRFYRYSLASPSLALSLPLPLSAYERVRETSPRNKFAFPISIFRRTKRHRWPYAIRPTVYVVSFKLFGCYVNGMPNHTCIYILLCVFCFVFFFSFVLFRYWIWSPLPLFFFVILLLDENRARRTNGCLLFFTQKNLNGFQWWRCFGDGYFMFYCLFCCAYMMILLLFCFRRTMYFAPFCFQSLLVRSTLCAAAWQSARIYEFFT